MLAAIRDGMRGLAVFIADIRNCKSKEAEVKRINKELSNIRSKIKGGKILDGYQKKKYVCKLLFIFLLGHDIDFGHMEAVNLLSSNKYSEKQIGYLFISVLVNTNSDLIQLIIQNIKNDLASRNPVHVNLAVQCIANIGSKEMAEAFGHDILKLLVSGDTMDFVKQSAALCLLRLLHTSQEIIPGGEWTSRIIDLLNNKHLGVVTAATSLIDALVKRNPNEHKDCISFAVSRLSRIVAPSYTDLDDYSYYFVPAPWLSVKLLRLLQNYAPTEDPIVRGKLNECLETILNKAQELPKSKKIQHSNAKNAVLFEAISLIVHNDNEPNLLVRACDQVGQFLSNRETNLRYLALESMCLLATSEFSHEAVKEHQEMVIVSMNMESDISVRQQAIDLLYAMCDYSNAEEIVQEMLNYLATAEYSMREEMVLKVAILAEKYATDYTWYVDVILSLINVAGDHVSEEIWYRVIQIVVNRDDVQGYAAKTVFEALKAPACHENMVKVGGYILGEFGNLIAGDKSSAPTVQFHLLHSKYHLCSPMTRALLLSTYIKFVNLFPELKPVVQQVFQQHCNLCSADTELQQRASEYLRLSIIASTNVLATVFEEMPTFPERESSTLAFLKKKKPGRVPENEICSPLAHNNLQADLTLNYNANSHQAALVTKNASTDILGLSTPSAPSNTSSVLLDILGDNYIGGSSLNSITRTVNQQDTYDPKKFVCENNGLLFENDLIQIGFQYEFRQNLGRLHLFYGNKTSYPLKGFSALLISPNDWVSKLCLQIQPVVPVLDAGVQIQQTIKVECIEDYTDAPSMNVSFIYNNMPQKLTLKLPIFINKFFEPVEMNGESFFARWKNLRGNPQKPQLIFCATQDMDLLSTRTKLIGFGMQLLEGIDPNPDNFVCAGIIHTRTQQVGCLLRLERNKQAQMYQLTVRSSKESISQEICELLSDHF